MYTLTIRADGNIFTQEFSTQDEAEKYGENFIHTWNSKHNFFSATNNSWNVAGKRIIKTFSGESCGKVLRGSLEIVEK